MPLLWSPPFNHAFVNAFPFELHVPFSDVSATQAAIWGWISLSLMWRWAVRRSVGRSPQAEQRGLMSSRGDSYVAEQCSHWSPRAPCQFECQEWGGRNGQSGSGRAHLKVALGAGSVDVTVGEETVVLLAVELQVLVLLQPAVLVQLEEDALADPAT